MREVLLYSVVLPLVVSGGSLLAAWWLARGRAHPDDGDPKPARGSGCWVTAVAFAASYLVCHLGVHGRPTSTPLEAWQWLLLLAPLAALLGVVDCLVTLPRMLRLIGAIALAAATGWFLVPSFQDGPWVWRLAIGATVFVLFVSQQCQSRDLAGIALPATWILVGSCGLPLLIASANAKFGFFSTSVAAAAGATFVACLFFGRGAQVARSAVPVVSVLFPAIFFSGYFNDYGDVPFVSFALLMAAPCGLWTGVLFQLWRPRRWTAAATGIASSAAMCAISLYFAWPAITAEPAY